MLKYNSRTGEWEGVTGGVDIKELDTRKPARKPKKDTQEEIRKEINQNENYTYALRLVDHIASEMNIKMGRPIFRNRAVSCYNPQTKQIWFSYENIDKSFEKGFAEYSTVGHVWVKNGYVGKQERICTKSGIRSINGHILTKASYSNVWKFAKGKQAIWMIVIHEMAHRLQHDSQGSFRGDHHGRIFLKELNELIILFPYDEVKNV